jgi:Ribbon-helix-helix protein, copG family
VGALAVFVDGYDATVYNSYIMRRTQIYLDEQQDAELGRRAAAEGLTKSALIRRAVDVYLNGAADEELRLGRFKAAVEAVAGVARDLPPGSRYVERVRALDAHRHEEIERRRRA